MHLLRKVRNHSYVKSSHDILVELFCVGNFHMDADWTTLASPNFDFNLVMESSELCPPFDAGFSVEALSAPLFSNDFPLATLEPNNLEPLLPLNLGSSENIELLVVNRASNILSGFSSALPSSLSSSLSSPSDDSTLLQASLTNMLRQNNMHNSLVLSQAAIGVENTLARFESAMAQLASQTVIGIKNSEERVISTLRSELGSAQQVLNSGLDTLRHASDARFDQVDQELQNLKHSHIPEEFKEQLKSVKDQLDELKKNSDRVSQAWARPENVHLRQIVAFICKIGLDTTCSQGMTPLIHFEYLPDRSPSDDTHITILSKALIRLILLHSDKFTTPVAPGIQLAVDKIITPIVNCLPTGVSAKTMREFGAAFPCEIYTTNGVYVFRTLDLIRMMKEELVYERNGNVSICYSFRTYICFRVPSRRMQILSYLFEWMVENFKSILD